MTWVDVIELDSLEPELGVPALVNGKSVALFRTHDGAVYALSNYDPVTRAPVMARGIVGTVGDVPVVASPMYKQHFDLRDGSCLEDAELALERYEVRIADRMVQVAEPARVAKSEQVA
jgi:nitrite reductase (NADH) small subunit